MIRHVTRFTEEIFALIIALVYLYEPFKKLYKVWNSFFFSLYFLNNLSLIYQNRFFFSIPFDRITITIIHLFVRVI